MAPLAVTFEALPAAYGDSLIVTCATPAGPWRLLVDTGTDECWSSLKEHLARLPVAASGQRHIDLVVISHIDHDHIGAAAALLSDTSLGLSFGDIWFNAPSQPASRGVAEGRSLASILGGTRTQLPWNVAWHGKSVVTPDKTPFLELPNAQGTPKITLLSPTPNSLATLFAVWDKELAKLGKSEKPEVRPAADRGGPPSLEELAAKSTPTDHAPANGSSIAFLLEHQGVSLLLAADVHPTILVPALNAVAVHRGLGLPIQVDVFKLSHHGSRANVTADVLEALQAQHYVVSTNGAIFGHPDDEAIARVVVQGGSKRRIWFNYCNEHTSKWDAADLQSRYDYAATFPAGERGTVEIALEPRVAHPGPLVRSPGEATLRGVRRSGPGDP
jgi:beta-lactamase superfamily II metal-dependent hydrolase